MSHSFSQGDRVRFLHQSGEGLILAVEDEGNTLLIEDQDGFPMRFASKECLPMPNLAEEAKAYASKDITKGELLERNVDEHQLKASQKDFDVKYRNPDATNMRKRDEHLEVDQLPRGRREEVWPRGYRSPVWTALISRALPRAVDASSRLQ